MKILFYSIISLFFTSYKICSQSLITVQNGSNVSFYTKLVDAVNGASSGDTIYATGGLNDDFITIDKKLVIIGFGHNPDSTYNLPTTIGLELHIKHGAEGGSLTGFKITQNVVFDANNTINGYTISRCNLQRIVVTNLVMNLNVSECLLLSIVTSNSVAMNCGFYNNMFRDANFTDQPYPFNNCTFKNNIFFNSGYCTFGRCGFPVIANYSLFENNIFYGNDNGLGLGGIQGTCTLNNNLIVSNTIPFMGTQNLINQPQSSIFVNQSGLDFKYSNDNHLQPTCPGKNAGSDGTDIGIYGGLYPWKDGSLPPNPHVSFKKIASSTDQNGNLQINMVVKAQKN